MGNLQNKLIELGQYCDCLQNWKKFEREKSIDDKSVSNINMSETQYNLQKGIEKAFQIQTIDNAFDGDLKVIQNRLKKRKKLKQEYFKQKQQEQMQRQTQKQQQQKQLLEKDRQHQEQYKRNILKITRQKELLDKQQLIKQKREEALKKRNEQLIRANKRNKKLHRFNQNKSLSAMDDLVLNIDFRKLNKNESNQEALYENIYEQKEPSESSSISTYRRNKENKIQLEIIDLEKLNPISVTKEVSQLALRKLKDNSDFELKSQTMPLHQFSLTHRQPKQSHQNKNKLMINQNDHKEQDQADIVQFVANEGQQEDKNEYFLDNQDKLQYMNRIKH